jgi:hypothetical protein
VELAGDNASPDELQHALDAIWDAMVAEGARSEPAKSFTELLWGAWDGFDMRQAAEDTVAPQPCVPDFEAGGDGTPVNVDEILAMP